MLVHFMYCRKSSEDEDRQVISNESQEGELVQLIKRDGLHIRDTIKEEASAKLARTRSQFNDMLKRIRQGEANGILCWHLNRLSRNAGDAAVLIELMDQNRLLEIRTPGQVFRNTPGDKFLITLFCSQAKLENDNKGVDVKRGLRAKAAMGCYPGVAPMGYLNDKTKLRGERDLYNDPERFPLVKRMWQMMLTGNQTPARILKTANEEWRFRTRQTKKQGGQPLSLSALYHIFHNPFYYGWFEYPHGSGKWYEGKHEPMVTKAEFDRVQAFLGRNGNPRASKHRAFAFTGLIRCGACAGMITAEEKHQLRCTRCRTKFACGKRDRCPRCQTLITQMCQTRGRHYTYYHCARRKAKCGQKSIEAAELENQILEQLDRIQISAKFKAWAFEYLKELYRDELITAQFVAQSRDKAYAECLKRLEALVKLKTSPDNADGSLLSDEEYSNERRKLLEEKAQLNSSPEDARLQAEQALHESEATFDFAHSARTKFVEGDFQVKREIIMALGSNLTLRDQKLIFEARKPFTFIETFTARDGRNSSRIEPEKTLVKYGRKGRTRPRFTRRLRDLKDVRTNQHKVERAATLIYAHFKKEFGFPDER